MPSILKSWLGIPELERQIMENRDLNQQLQRRLDDLTLSHIDLLDDKYKTFRGTKGQLMSACVADEIRYITEFYMDHKKSPSIDTKFEAWQACIKRNGNTPFIREWPPSEQLKNIFS